jgi:hypothetical protein
MNILKIHLKYKLKVMNISLIINQIIIIMDVYKYMLIMMKHHFACDQWDFKWLLLDDKSNPYIDLNQFNCKLVAC